MAAEAGKLTDHMVGACEKQKEQVGSEVTLYALRACPGVQVP